MRMKNRLGMSLSRRTLIIIGISMLIGGLLALSLQFAFSYSSYAGNALHPFTITSPDFHDGGPLSRKQEFNQGDCTGSNLPPELHWDNVPAGAHSLVLFMSDYDAPVAGGFHHWVVYNIPTSAHELKGKRFFTEGTNDFGLPGYSGPCPPATGETHHYLFLLYATDLTTIGRQDLTFTQVMSALQNHVMGATSTIGTFKRP